MNTRITGLITGFLAGLWIMLATDGATAAPMLIVTGASTYDRTTGKGLTNQSLPYGNAVNNSGTAIGYGIVIASGDMKGTRPMRWQAAGNTTDELANLGTDSRGITYMNPYAINNAGTVVGNGCKYVSGEDMGSRAVRWNAGGTAITELGTLGVDAYGFTYADAMDINAGGTTVGFSSKYVSGYYYGDRAVRWKAGSTTAIELGNLGTDLNGRTISYANCINTAGTIAGECNTFVSGECMGFRAVRWNASGTVVTQLDNLGTDARGYSTCNVCTINDTGTIAGQCRKYVAGVDMGSRAVRWNAGGTAITELGNLGTDSNGFAYTEAYTINAAGTVVGSADKYVSGVKESKRAVRWDAGGTVATELGGLGIVGTGYVASAAIAINDAGTAVGYYEVSISASVDGRAVVWLPDATAVDMNELGVAPNIGGGTWKLTRATDISADGWVAGEGIFDPDGEGPIASYRRSWVGQVGLGGSWLNTTGTNNTWGKGNNWSTGTPAIQCDAKFYRKATYSVAFAADQVARSACVTAGNVIFALGEHSLTLSDGLSVSAGARLSSNGTIAANITNDGTLVVNSGLGTLTINGDFDNTGVLEFEIYGKNVSQFDRLLVTGQAGLGGSVCIIMGYIPAFGDRFDILDYGSLADNGYSFDFSTAELPDGLVWDTSLFGSTGTISVVPDPAALSLLALGGLVVLRRRRA